MPGARPVEDRFWEKVVCDIATGCWLWTGSLTKSGGYGQIHLNGAPVRAHRLSWFMAYGKWPTDVLCHHCDTPRCVRPDHMFDGTRRQNTHDALAKHRPIGRPRVYSDEVIRDILTSPESAKDIARRLGLSAGYVAWRRAHPPRLGTV